MEILKLLVDSVMLIWFIMEFRVFKSLLSNFITFQQKCNKMNVDLIRKQIKKQNIFVSCDP